MSNEYSINTKGPASVPAGAHPAVVAGFVGLGRQANKFDASKPPQTRFVLLYRLIPDGGEMTTWAKTYSASWGPKASFQKDCAMLFTAEEIGAGQIAPTQLLGRPCQLIFTTTRDESGAEKVGLAAVGSLPKTAANIEAVKALKGKESFSFDASKGERPGLDALNALPKWLLEQIESAGPVQAAPATPTWTAPNNLAPAPASPTVAFMAGQSPQMQTAQPATAAPLNDNLDDVPW